VVELHPSHPVLVAQGRHDAVLVVALLGVRDVLEPAVAGLERAVLEVEGEAEAGQELAAVELGHEVVVPAGIVDREAGQLALGVEAQRAVVVAVRAGIAVVAGRAGHHVEQIGALAAHRRHRAGAA
jgi:hypothetical protein